MTMRRAILATSMAAAAFAMQGRAVAEEETPPAEAPPPREPARWAVGFNPAAITIGRYGVDVIRLVAPHVAAVANVHVDYGSKDWPSAQYDGLDPYYGVGGELGVRFFLSHQYMRGFFIGPSMLAGWYSVPFSNTGNASNNIHAGLPGFGVAVDIGGQINLGYGMFLVLAGGLQGRWTTAHPQAIASGVQLVAGNGAVPRFIMTFGLLFK
jgi:hypothetical protein